MATPDQFTSRSDFQDTDNFLGYREAATGGEARWTWAVLKSALQTLFDARFAPVAHASSTSNPHSVTKAQVGLSDVDNTSDAAKPVSTAQAAADAVVAAAAASALAGHTHSAATTGAAGFLSASDKSKLDGVATGAQVNPTTASQAEAEAGTNNVTMMTPLRTAQAIEALASGGGGSSANDKKTFTQSGHSFVAEQPVYHNGTQWVLAVGDALASSRVVGVVESVDGDDFVVVTSGSMVVAGRTPGATGYLSTSVEGQVTETEPTGSGFLVEIWTAVSATEAIVSISEPLSLAKIANADLEDMPAGTVKANITESTAAPGNVLLADLAAALPRNAEDVTFSPAGNIAATDVQAAVEELDAEKEPALTEMSVSEGTAGISTVPRKISASRLKQIVEAIVAAAADSTAPELTGARIVEAGDRLELTFSEPVTAGVDGFNDFLLTFTGGAVTATYSEGDGTITLLFDLSRTVFSSETGTMDFTAPADGVQDAAGNLLATITDNPVDNDSTQAPVVATPEFSPAAGAYGSTQSVSVTCDTADALIYYTTNGSDPTESDTLVEGTIAVATGVTLKAKAFKTGYTSSAVATAVYTINPTLLSATVEADGVTWTLVFSAPVSQGAGSGTLSATLSSGTTSLTLTGGEDTDTLTYTGSNTVNAGVTGTVAYTQDGNGLEDAAGNDVQSFSGFAFSNESEQGGVTYQLEENFESTPTGWTTVVGTPNYEWATAPAPLEGTKSLRLLSTGQIYKAIPSATVVEAFTKFSYESAAGALSTIMSVRDSVGSMVAAFRVNGATGQVTIYTAAGDSSPCADVMVPNTEYDVWLRWSSGALSSVAFIEAGGTRPTSGSKFQSKTGGSATGARIYLYGGVSSPSVFDRVLILNGGAAITSNP